MSSVQQGKQVIYEMSRPGRTGCDLPPLDVPEQPAAALIGGQQLRTVPPHLPEVSEVAVVRHYTGLSRRNYGVDNGFYPLGSCTMKYNPKINEETARLAGFSKIHPLQPGQTVQGALSLLYELQNYLAEIAGMDGSTLQPVAGAHGELTGLKLIRAYHQSRGENRTKVIVPDSAHGTNPATVTVCGLEAVEIKSNPDGSVDLEALRAVAGPDTAAFMLTNPSTLGLFETQIREIADIIHQAGGLLYYDGANANAILGITRPGDMGFDVVHFNLHKTFSTPHGGGGPGSGPVGVKDKLLPFLPVPVVAFDGEQYFLQYDKPESIGKVHSFYGNFAVMVRAYTYIRMLGPDGLRQASEDAVLNANYMMQKLKDHYTLPYDRTCMHEFVLSAEALKAATGCSAMDVAKKLIDYGIHPPTMYFPLIVLEALMIEPTETESRETLDHAVNALIEIASLAETAPDELHAAPVTTPVGRMDEVAAARKPKLRWRP